MQYFDPYLSIKTIDWYVTISLIWFEIPKFAGCYKSVFIGRRHVFLKRKHAIEILTRRKRNVWPTNHHALFKLFSLIITICQSSEQKVTVITCSHFDKFLLLFQTHFLQKFTVVKFWNYNKHVELDLDELLFLRGRRDKIFLRQSIPTSFIFWPNQLEKLFKKYY